MLTGSNTADSMITASVDAPTSDAAPPMTPAMASGPFASAMRSVSGVRARATWSSVSSRSPSRALRTTRAARPLESRATAPASKAWVGLPSSSITKLVASTTLLTGRMPAASSRRCTCSGDGATRTPSTRRATKRGQSSGSSTATTSESPIG